MPVRLPLKMAILRAGRSQRELAASMHMTENKFSAICCGWREPTEDERLAIARALGLAAGDLFETPPPDGAGVRLESPGVERGHGAVVTSGAAAE